MDNKNSKIWTNISFKTQKYHKNYDMLNWNEHVMTECAGTITSLRLKEQKPPVIIGEYSYTTFDIATALLFNSNVKKLLLEYSVEDVYAELFNIVDNNDIDIFEYDKVILVHSLMLHPDFRKSGISEEFIEMLHREYYNEKTAIIALVKPFQSNTVESDYYLNRRTVEVRESLRDAGTTVPSIKYYGLEKLIDDKDIESATYKLFGVANRCGFDRINDSHLFMYRPDKIVARMMDKHRDGIYNPDN